MQTRPLIVRLRNWVGDVILGVPALKLLASHGYQLQLIGKGWAPALLQELPRGMWSWGPVVAACCAVTWGWDGLARMTGLDRGRGGHAA